jgi:hypothetical protein
MAEFIPYHDLPLPDLDDLRPIGSGQKSESTRQPVKYLDDLLTERFLESYFKRKKS